LGAECGLESVQACDQDALQTPSQRGTRGRLNVNPIYSGVQILFGTVLLYGGAESLIYGGASLALRMGISVLVISLTIMGYGTGTPELVVSLQASLDNKGDIVVGNVIGSNIANTALILGGASFIRPLAVKRQLVRYDGPVMVFVSFTLCAIFALGSNIGRGKGLFLFISLLFYTFWTIYLGLKEKKIANMIEGEGTPLLTPSVFFDLFWILIGFVCLFFGGTLFLEGATAIAKRFHVSDRVIGLTLVAFGTSLPELATSLVSLLRSQSDIAIGNVVGSNIFNILAIIGLAAIVEPIHLVNMNWIDFLYLASLSLFLWIVIFTGRRIARWEGGIMLSSYVVYMGYLFLT